MGKKSSASRQRKSSEAIFELTSSATCLKRATMKAKCWWWVHCTSVAPRLVWIRSVFWWIAGAPRQALFEWGYFVAYCRCIAQACQALFRRNRPSLGIWILEKKIMFLIIGHTIIHNTPHSLLPISTLNFPKAALYNRSHPHFSIHLPKNSIISQNLFSIFNPHYKIPLLITLLLTLPPLKSTQIPSPPKNPTHHYIP